jgi:lysophospholipase L1-like esterase
MCKSFINLGKLIIFQIILIFCLFPLNSVCSETWDCSLDTGVLDKQIVLPDPEFEKKDSARIFNGRDLYDYINGGADEYLDAGFRSLWVKEFEGSGSGPVVVELYCFSKAEGAKQVYAANRGGQEIALGQEGSLSEHGYLIFYRDEFLCRILSFGSQDTEQLSELGYLVETALTGEAEVQKGSSLMKDQKSDTIVILGASYAKDWTIDRLGGMDVVNKGIGGQQTGEILGRFKTDVAGQNPRVVIIWGFINDIFRTDRDRIDETLKQAKENLETMVKLAGQHNIEPILVTEVTIRPKDGLKEAVAGLAGKLLGKQSYQDYVNEKVMALNGWVKKYADENGLLLLDFQQVLASESGERKKKYAAPDGSHISEAGYQRLSEYARTVIKTSPD